jgi:DinB superfamily
MLPTTPYTKHLGNREPIASMRETSERIRSLTSGWSPQQFERTYAPGKWTARQILTHLAETDMALGYRVRMALSNPGYVAQPFDQDAWIAKETRTGGAEAVAAYFSLRQMNLTLFASLSPVDRQTPFAHAEYGAISVDWVIHQMAGHDRNHLAQLETIAKL